MIVAFSKILFVVVFVRDLNNAVVFQSHNKFYICNFVTGTFYEEG